MWPLSQILPFQNLRDLLLQKEKLVWAQEEKFQILVAIHASLLAVTEKAVLLQAAGDSFNFGVWNSTNTDPNGWYIDPKHTSTNFEMKFRLLTGL